MGRADHYRHGDNNVICDRCGFKYKASDLKREWNGLYTCKFDWEPRHPQDLIKSKHDDQRPSLSRPGAVDVFVPSAIPRANAWADQTVGRNITIQLDGSASSDVDDEILTYLWAQTAGITVVLSSTTSATPTFTSPIGFPAGIDELLTFSLVVNDSESDSPADTVVITVTANIIPIADAGINQSVVMETTAQLDGSASADPEGAPLTYLWSQTVGQTVVLDDNTLVNPSFPVPYIYVDETLTFSLVVNDAEDNSLADTVDVLLDIPTDAWDITTSALNGSYSPSGEGSAAVGLVFSAARDFSYVLYGSNDTIHQYDIGTKDDISTMSLVSPAQNFVTPNADPEDIHLGDGDTKLYILDRLATTVYQHSLSVAGDISTASVAADKSFNFGAVQINLRGMWFKPDGTKIYLSGGSASVRIWEWTLSTPWDISTMSSPQSKTTGANILAPYSVYVRPDGKRLYLGNEAGNVGHVYRFDLSTAWDITTMSGQIEFYNAFLTTREPSGIFFSPVGSTYWLADRNNAQVDEYTMGTP
jgi:hypothetical protein